MLRPQPLGIFPLPAGYLVLPPVAESVALQADLLRGHIPDAAPPELIFYLHALHGDAERAAQTISGDTPEDRYNRFVLSGDLDQYLVLRTQLQGDLGLLLAIVAYTLGYSDELPDPGSADGELCALALLTHAAAALERQDGDAAMGLLKQAITAAQPASPLFAAQLLSNLAETHQRFIGNDAMVLQHLRTAEQLLATSGLVELRAQIALNLGLVYHDMAQGRREVLLEAVKYYQEALQIFTRDNAPEWYALAQNNLALAYLAMPLTEASDQLRKGIAVQSLREALKVYTPETHPDQWASAQLNLANALQHLPSTNPQNHLVEAVELYEAVLAVRDRDSDPLGYGRVLANQGNALAHLGIFVHAKPKLQEAVRVFTAYGDGEAAMALREILAEIERQEQARREPEAARVVSG
ncbi:MAG: tetratricopeptide repeat protein [Oscillochloris sp.]|nr:tetratricopeptide repeat protein [Oscillochloris sp.]